MAKKRKKAVSVFGEKLHFADGVPVDADLFENEPSEAAMDRMDAISDDEFDEEDRILDLLLEDLGRADELAGQGGITYLEN